MELGSPDAKTIQSFFNAIPERYDFLNSFLSLSLDRFWRKKLVQTCLEGSERSILDIGVGTGTSLLEFLKRQDFERVVGCDFSEGMLKAAKEKVAHAFLLGADLHQLPFQSERFDLITSSFVLRSVKQMDLFLSEVKRVLSKNGKFAFLDLTRPANLFFWNLLYKPYLNFYLPLVGKMISKHRDAYQFLSQSIQTFVDPAALKKKTEDAGFHSVMIQPLTFGIATILTGRKAS